MPGASVRRFAAFAVASLTAAPALCAGAAPPATLDAARSLHAAGRLPEAEAAYRGFLEKGGKADPGAAGAAYNNLCVLLVDLGRHREALAACEEALALRRHGGEGRALGRTLNNLGLALQNLGRFAEAEVAFSEALALNRSLGDREGEAINLANLGGTATWRGRYSVALDYHRRAAALASAHPDESWAPLQAAVARINEGVVLEKVGAFREALAIYKALLTGPEVLGPDRRAHLAVNAGVLWRNLGDPVRAVAEFDAAVAAFTANGDATGLATAHLNRALALAENLARPRAALVDLDRALSLARQAGDRVQEIQVQFYRGRLLAAAGRAEAATEAFTDCLKAAETSGLSEGVWSSREGLGRLAAARGDTPAAREHFDRALAEIERVRADLAPAPEWAGAFFGARRGVYEAAIALAVKEGRGDDAFALVQRAKARDLLDALGPTGDAGTGQAPGGHLGIPLSAAEAASAGGDELLLETFLTADALYVWAVERAGVRLVAALPAAPIRTAVASVHRALAGGGEPLARDLATLAAALLAPVADRLAAGRAVVVATDGLLAYLPLEVLPNPADPTRPLVATHPVRYLPSASARGARPRRQLSLALDLAGLGDPRLPDLGASPDPAALLVARFDLHPLPGAAVELAEIARRVGGKTRLATGVAATEAALAELAGSARILHLATHALADERPGRGSAILLTSDGTSDGLATPAEISRLPIAADLAVLSACRTALATGEGAGGRALSSLTGAFLAAGAGGVVATLWDVGDSASAVFMEEFYRRLAAGRPPNEALAETKRALAADPRWARPALWGAYVLVGEGRAPVAGAGRRRLRAAALATALVLAAAGAWLLRGRVTRTPADRGSTRTPADRRRRPRSS